jgi:hypothetical protein
MDMEDNKVDRIAKEEVWKPVYPEFDVSFSLLHLLPKELLQILTLTLRASSTTANFAEQEAYC